jgi:CubicO group peptidase (beta-lactamase class C family)
MGKRDEVGSWLDERLAGLIAEHNVPGAAIAVLVGDEICERAAGALNTATGVAATTDSVFQLASIAKAFTATLVMQLVDEGKLDLDRPVRDYLPGFRVADEETSATVTPRHLLSHTAGFDSEPFTESPHGDGAIEWFVDQHLPTVGQLFRPGEHFSYSNPGFTLLGRIVEVLRGKPYRRVLREHLIGPLGLEHWGLGLCLEYYGQDRVTGHDGDNIGQHARMRFLPDWDVAFVVFCNGGNASGFLHSVAAHLLAELAGIELPPRLAPPTAPRRVEPQRYVGHYQAAEGRYTVTASGAGQPVSELLLSVEPGPRHGRAAFLHHLRAIPRRTPVLT